MDPDLETLVAADENARARVDAAREAARARVAAAREGPRLRVRTWTGPERNIPRFSPRW